MKKHYINVQLKITCSKKYCETKEGLCKFANGGSGPRWKCDLFEKDLQLDLQLELKDKKIERCKECLEAEIKSLEDFYKI